MPSSTFWMLGSPLIGMAATVSTADDHAGTSAPSRAPVLIPAPESLEQIRANPTDPLLSRRANPGLILPIHYRSLTASERGQVDTALAGTGWEPLLGLEPVHRLERTPYQLAWEQ